MRTAQQREQTRLIMLAKWQDPEYRAMQVAAHKGKPTWASQNLKKGMTTNTGKTWFKKGQLANEKHHFWKGNNVGYDAIHNWVNRNYGSPRRCEDCGTEDALKYDWANISGQYKRDKFDWRRLCRKCHHAFDDIANRGWITRRRNLQLS